MKLKKHVLHIFKSISKIKSNKYYWISSQGGHWWFLNETFYSALHFGEKTLL